MTEQLQKLAESAKDSLILQTPEGVLRRIEKNVDKFELPSNDELWPELCELLDIDEDNSEALQGRRIIYQPDFGLNKIGYKPTIQKIIDTITVVRGQIVNLLRSKGAQCLVLEQTEHATFLSDEKYFETSSGWAKVDGEEGVVCKITPLNGKRLDSEAFCFNDGPLTHPNIVPEYHVFVANDPQTYVVSFAPDYSTAQNLYKLNYQGYQHQPGKLLSVLRDTMRGYAYAHSKGRVNADNSLSNMLVPQNDGAFSGLAADTLSMVKNGTRFDIKGVSRTEAYSELSFYDYDPTTEKFSDATDVYALGCIMFELLLRRPFHKNLESFYKKTKRKSLNNQEREKAFFEFITTEIKKEAKVPQDTEAAFTDLIKSMIQADRSARPTLDRVLPQFEELIRAVQVEEEREAEKVREFSGDSAEDTTTASTEAA